jgi:hypothetical protein
MPAVDVYFEAHVLVCAAYSDKVPVPGLIVGVTFMSVHLEGVDRCCGASAPASARVPRSSLHPTVGDVTQPEWQAPDILKSLLFCSHHFDLRQR